MSGLGSNEHIDDLIPQIILVFICPLRLRSGEAVLAPARLHAAQKYLRPYRVDLCDDLMTSVFSVRIITSPKLCQDLGGPTDLNRRLRIYDQMAAPVGFAGSEPVRAASRVSPFGRVGAFHIFGLASEDSHLPSSHM